MGEDVAVALVLNFLDGMGVLYTVDGFGNVHANIGVDYGESRTMFSCHLDTVHREVGDNPIHYDGKYITSLDGSCLGADDGAGVYLMLEMIRERVPGYYIFHLGEEVGGLGSQWIVNNMGEKFLEQFHRCIAFDRKGTEDIITHQFYRCSSDKFADDLGTALAVSSSGQLVYIADDSGVFTDSANYMDYIPECTNLSVGYYDEHTGDERQDFPFLQTLLAALIDIDWEMLSTDRNPEVEEMADMWGADIDYINAQDTPHDTLTIVSDLIRHHPNEIARILINDGYDEFELDEKLTDLLGEP